jgi:hypothetical protein
LTEEQKNRANITSFICKEEKESASPSPFKTKDRREGRTGLLGSGLF